MARRVNGITDDTIQRHRIAAEGMRVEITLRWAPQVASWFADVVSGDRARYGVRLVVGALHVESANMPVDLVVRDRSGLGLDPTRRDDFSSRRCELFVMMPKDMEAIRGAPVPV